MFCQNCGAQNNDNASFCAKCGSKLAKPEELQKQDVPKETKTEEIPAQDTATVQDTSSIQNSAINKGGQVPPVLKKPVNKKPFPIWAIIAGAAVIGVIVLFVIGNMVISSISGPESVAKKFMQAEVDKDWSKAYDCLSVNESEFVNKDVFTNLKSQNTDDEIASFTINSKDVVKEGDGAYSVQVNYKLKNKSNSDTKYLEIVKSDNSPFFGKWKVRSSDEITENYYLNCPKKATLFLDGVEVTDKYIDNSDAFDDTSNKYNIGEVFNEDHTVKMTSPIYQDIEKQISKDSPAFFAGTAELQLNSQTKQDTQKFATDFINKYYQTVVARSSFSTIKDYFSSDSKKLEEIEKNYNDDVDSIKDKTNPSIGISKIDLSDVSVIVKDGYGGTEGDVMATISYNVSASGKRTKFFSNETEDFSYQSSSKETTMLYLSYEDGKWVVTDMQSLYMPYF